MKTKILILGSTGLLGNTVAKYFLNNNAYDVVTTYRNKKYAFDGNSVFFDVLSEDFTDIPRNVDYVINCIGIIKPFMSQSIKNAITINSLFPHKLSEWCEENSSRMIHITTDCVFSGARGKYTESDKHDPTDAYGKSKSLGECADNAMVLRTSIIGNEIHKNASLVAWAKSQKGCEVNGYVNHFWNGVTTGEYAKICDKIISADMYEKGLFHVHAADDVTKNQMLYYFNDKYDLQLKINPYKADEYCDRTLRTEKELCSKLNIPTVKEMIEEMQD